MPAKILVVDDEAAIRRLLRNTLTRAGYAVVEAEDGRQALHQADSARPARHALDRAGGFERFQVVLGAAHAPIAKGLGDLGLGWGHALGGDAFADVGKDGVLGFGQFHG